MNIKIILALLFAYQALALRTTHLSTGSSAMQSVDTSALITFIVIGVVAVIIVAVIVYCIFKEPYYRDAYSRGGAY